MAKDTNKNKYGKETAKKGRKRNLARKCGQADEYISCLYKRIKSRVRYESQRHLCN